MEFKDEATWNKGTPMTEAREQRPWAILVIWPDGDEEYLKQGMSVIPAKFRTRSDAIEQTKFMKIGMDGDCQSINVVPYPEKADWV